MPAVSVAPHARNRNMYPNNKVMPVTDEWQRGYDARKSRRPITVCGSDEMTAGWCAADDDAGRAADARGADCYMRAAYADGVPLSGILSVVWGG